MRLTKICTTTLTAISIASLTACSTVDLSQIVINQPQEVSEKPKHNVVERATHSLTSMFKAKGWCKSDPNTKTQTATNVLLNGLDTGTQNTAIPVLVVSTQQLSDDLTDAEAQIKQTTKAAEVFLVMAEDMADLGAELSQLEAALLVAREAETGFGKALETSSNLIIRRKYASLSSSIDGLKTVTDAYGDRIRLQIASRASTKRS
ncbi:MAG: hypothetical protein L3J05_08875 [Robiginitomaculum sp.]|nr:hypothetical protein [Robiginitomaculum sp.]